MPGRKIVIFVHGCFWHSHQGCKNSNLPKSNQDFWKKKLQGNVQRDLKVKDELLEQGWRVLWVWECATRKKANLSQLATELRLWIESTDCFGEIPANFQ